MRRQNAERFRSRCVRWFCMIGLTFIRILLVATWSHAGILTVSWTAPTTNTDGSALTDLALYRAYYSTSDSPCPGATFAEVATSSSMPPPNQIVNIQLMGLTTGWIYSVSVTAIDTLGNESACSAVASAIAQDDSAIPPSAIPPTDTTIPRPGSVTTPPGTSTPRQ